MKRNIIHKSVAAIATKGLIKWMPDKPYLKLMYWATTGKRLDLKNPKTFNEKLQWLKLYNRNPKYTTAVDKSMVKQYVSEIIGNQYIIPTLGVWDKFDEIDFDKLPSQFVLKCTHDSGGVIICKDKSEFDIECSKEKINHFLKRKFFYFGREWPYKDVKPRIIAEKYMEDAKTNELRDYKFFCFDGEVKALFVASDRQTKGAETKFDFFDENYKHLDVKNGHPNASVLPEKPQNFEKMKELAAKLSVGIPHVRVDLYEVNGKIYFGEMTFSHWSGFVPFDPEEWDYKFGDWIKLPKKDERI